MNSSKTIDDFEFEDAVMTLPKNAIEVVYKVKVYEDGEIHELEGTYGVNDIREAFQLFNETVSGNYPKFVLSEKYLEKLKTENMYII